MKAILNPITNPSQQSLTPEEVWRRAVNAKVQEGRSPINVPNVVSQGFRSEKIVNGLIGQIGTTGIWGIGKFATNRGYLQSPRSFKLDNVNDITVNTNVAFVQEVNFATAPSPDGGYTMYLYVVVQKLEQGLTSFVDPYFILRFPFVYEQTPEERFYFDEPTIELRLADTVARETVIAFGTDYPNFATNPTKITLEQYNEFANSSVTLISGWGFDIGQLGGSTPTPNPVLSTNNKNHFEYFLFGNSGPFDGFTYLSIDIQHIFTYSGTFAEFTPLTN